MNKVTDLVSLKEILLQEIINNANFDVLDYYELTDINYFDLLLVLEKNIGLTSSERRVLNSFFQKARTKINNVFYCNNPEILKNLEFFKIARYREYLCISGIVITNEMKEHAIEYLLTHNIPVDMKTYIAVLRRMVAQIKEEALAL